MKLNINKKQFIQSWSLAERSTSSSSSMNILSSVLVKADEDKVTLQATDVRTSIICTAAGVSVQEPGAAVFPIKMVGDLFKKAPGEEFSLMVDEGRAVLKAGRSRYNFSTYPVREFPNIPSSAAAKPFCVIKAGEFEEVIEEGTLAASSGEEYPLYLSSANFLIKEGKLMVISTDTRRLALSSVPVSGAEDAGSALLPMKGIKEVQRILGSLAPESQVEILCDDAQFYFRSEGVEFTVRRVESHFPQYEKIITNEQSTTVMIDRGELISALDRVDIIVRDFTRMVVLDIAPDESLVLRGKAPDFGQAKEEVGAEIKGEKIRIAVNSKFFMDALKVLREPTVSLSFKGAGGHMAVRHPNDNAFLCLIAPINLSEDELKADFSEE